MQGAFLDDARLQGANLGGAQLQGADLRGADLQAANIGCAVFGFTLKCAQLQGADLRYAQLQGAVLYAAQLQGANLDGAGLQGAYLYCTELQGVDLSNLDLADSEFDEAFVFRTKIGNADIATAAIHSVHPDQVKIGDYDHPPPPELSPLKQSDIDAWIASAQQFANESDIDGVNSRFARLKPDFQDDEQTPRWSGMQEASAALDPDGTHHRQRLAALLGDLACDTNDAPYVAHGLLSYGRLSTLGDQLSTVLGRMKAGRRWPESCPGVAGFSEDDWRALDAVRPDQN